MLFSSHFPFQTQVNFTILFPPFLTSSALSDSVSDASASLGESVVADVAARCLCLLASVLSTLSVLAARAAMASTSGGNWTRILGRLVVFAWPLGICVTNPRIKSEIFFFFLSGQSHEKGGSTTDIIMLEYISLKYHSNTKTFTCFSIEHLLDMFESVILIYRM